MELFAVRCLTCKARLKVTSTEAIGQILSCPKCGSMVQVAPPAGWQPGQASEPSEPRASSPRSPAPATTEMELARAPLAPPTRPQTIPDGAPAASVVAAVTQPVAASVPVVRPAPATTELPEILQPATQAASTNWLAWSLVPVAGIAAAAVTWWLAGDSRSTTEVATAPVEQVATQPEPAPPSASKEDTSDLRLDARQSKVDPPIAATPEPAPTPTIVEPPALPPVVEPAPAAAPTPPVEVTPQTAADLPTVEVAATNQVPAPPIAAAQQLEPAGEPMLPPDTIPEIDVAARLAMKIPGMQISKAIPLASFARNINMLYAPLSFDLDALADVGVTLDDPITLDAKNLTVAEVLEQVLKPKGLVAADHAGLVLITTAARLKSEPQTRSHDAADLAGREPDKLVELVRQVVEPMSWDSAGGEGTARVLDGKLVVRQPADIQELVATLLDQLRTARKLPVKQANRRAVRTGSRTSLAQSSLDRPVTANYSDPQPLSTILGRLEQMASVNLPIDGVALAAVGRHAGSQTTLIVQHWSLREALDDLLPPLGLGWRAVDARTIQITSKRVVEQQGELEIYPVAGASKSADDPRALVERITSQVAAGRWRPKGNPGAIVFDEPSRSVLVWQTQPAQRQVEKLLRDR